MHSLMYIHRESRIHITREATVCQFVPKWHRNFCPDSPRLPFTRVEKMFSNTEGYVYENMGRVEIQKARTEENWVPLMLGIGRRRELRIRLPSGKPVPKSQEERTRLSLSLSLSLSPSFSSLYSTLACLGLRIYNRPPETGARNHLAHSPLHHPPLPLSAFLHTHHRPTLCYVNCFKLRAS